MPLANEWGGHRLALIGVTLRPFEDSDADDALGIIDLCDPHALIAHACRPDALASSDRVRTQAIATHLYATGALGFRWWSALRGDWHTTVLFTNRVTPKVLHWEGTAEPLTVAHPAVRSAAMTLGVEV
jgi:hypothetical protein